ADVLLRPPERSDEDAGVLRLAPRCVLERVLGEEPLERLLAAQGQIGLLGAAGDVSPLRLLRLQRRAGIQALEVGAKRLIHSVRLKEREQLGDLLLDDWLREDPPPVLRV